MGCRAAVAGVIACVAATARAGDAPEPTQAPPDVSWYGGRPPAQAPEVAQRVRHIILREGAFVLAGGTLVDGALAGRLDLGVPMPIQSAPRLRIVLVTEGSYETRSDMTQRRTLAITPAAQYEWHLPLEMKTGELLFIMSAGIRRSTLWIKPPDAPFYPSAWDSESTYAARLCAGIEFRGQRGLIVSAQPSVGLPFGTPTPPDPRWMEPAPTNSYAVSVIAGYQFR